MKAVGSFKYDPVMQFVGGGVGGSFDLDKKRIAERVALLESSYMGRGILFSGVESIERSIRSSFIKESFSFREMGEMSVSKGVVEFMVGRTVKDGVVGEIFSEVEILNEGKEVVREVLYDELF